VTSRPVLHRRRVRASDNFPRVYLVRWADESGASVVDGVCPAASGLACTAPCFRTSSPGPGSRSFLKKISSPRAQHGPISRGGRLDTTEVVRREMHNTVRPMSDVQRQEQKYVSKVSVIIPTKNRTNDLRRTLDSLIIQTRRPDEIIVVDQGSSPALNSSDFPIPLTYVHAAYVSGAAVARNVAMDERPAISGYFWTTM